MADDKNKTMWIVVAVIAVIIVAIIILYLRRVKADNGNGNGNGNGEDPYNYMKITVYTPNPAKLVVSFYDHIHDGRVSKYVNRDECLGFLTQWLAEARINQIQYDAGVAQFLGLM